MEFDTYIFVFLRRNPDYVSQGEERDKEISAGHFAFIEKQIKSKNMILAGPLDGAGGLYFFDESKFTKEEVLELLEQDESIKMKVFLPEVHKWYVPKYSLIFTADYYNKMQNVPESS